MKVLIRQFLGKNHSWSVCGWGIANALIKSGHQVELFSTDGVGNLPNNLHKHLIGFQEEGKLEVIGKIPSNDYDAVFSYTAMKNFPNYLSHSKNNKTGMWLYEWKGKNILPNGFAKHYKSCDKLIAPSNFGKEVFMDSGIPESYIHVIPHGISDSFFYNQSTLNISNKKFKILSNIAQNHLRKNIPGLLESYGRAFTKEDDVCLILKGKHKNTNSPFEVSLNQCLNDFKKKFPNHAEIKVLSEFIIDLSDLYRSIDCVFTMAFAEGFYMPGLESIASGKLAIAPKWGGQLDFLNESNSLLIEGNEVRADPKSMYWESKSNAIWFKPSIEDAVTKLKFAYNNFEQLNKNILLNKKEIQQRYSWDTVTKQITDLWTC